MNALNSIDYVGPPLPDDADLAEKLSHEGFSMRILRPEENPAVKVQQAQPAAVLVSDRLDGQDLEALVAHLKEHCSHLPVVLMLSRDSTLENLPFANAVCYRDMASRHLALALRGAIRASFTIRELLDSNRKLNEISITDALTGVYNRGYLMDRLNLEFKRAERSRQTLSCIMIDLDHFKQINDTYGHKFGDLVLQDVARRIQNQIREIDIFGRYGGEEFLLVLPETSQQGAELLGEKLRESLESMPFKHDCFSLTITASFGVASTESPDVLTADHLLQFSDRALYQAKGSGRNRVCVAGRRESDAAKAADAATHGDSETVHRVAYLAGDPAREGFLPLVRESDRYEVTVFKLPQDLVSAVGQDIPDAVVIDNGDGAYDLEQIVPAVKNANPETFVPLIVLASEPKDDMRDNLAELGADDVLPMHARDKEFLARLRSMAHIKRLHDRWRETFRNLNQARTRLIKVERLTALGEMATGVAHDFNNVLSAILGRTQLLRKQIDEPRMVRDLQVIERAAQDGAATIRRIQEFSRATSERAYHRLDMAEIVQDCIQMTRTRWKDRAEMDGITYRFDTDLASGLTVLGSATELREVITNLIMNSLDAMPQGGEIFIRGLCDGQDVELTLRDTGQGMDEEVVKRIFDPFFSTKEGEGTGLGLSVAYGIVMRHNGHIECASTRDHGTTFRLRFPHVASAGDHVPAGPEPAEQPAEAEERAPAQLRILVVDDEPPVREILRDVLSDAGHTVYVADSGHAAMEVIQAQSIDLLFTDLSMPEMSGWEVARRVRKLSPDTRIVLTSGWGKDFNREHLTRHGVDAILPKPVSFEALHDLTRRVARGQELSLDAWETV